MQNMVTAEEIIEYLSMSELVDKGIYQIVGRNAFVGIWLASENAFMISRYKCGSSPFVHYEYHWDVGTSDETGSPAGTAKPLKLIEICMHEVSTRLENSVMSSILSHLDRLESDHPILPGINTLNDRKKAALDYYKRLSGKNS